MNGHFCIEYFNGLTHNNTLEKCAKHIKSHGHLKIRSIAFICTYGCGVRHEVTADDRKALGLNANLTRRTDVDALIELCDKAAEVADNCGELGSSSPSDVRLILEEVKAGLRDLCNRKPAKPKKRKG